MTAVHARGEKSAGSSVSTGRGVARTAAATSSSSATQSAGSGISQPSGLMLSRVQDFLSSTSSGATCTANWSTRIGTTSSSGVEREYSRRPRASTSDLVPSGVAGEDRNGLAIHLQHARANRGHGAAAQRTQDLVRPGAAALHQSEVLDGRQAQGDVL